MGFTVHISDRREITPAISPKNQLSLKNIYSYFTRIVFHVSKCIFISISEYKHMAVKDYSRSNIEVTTLVILGHCCTVWWLIWLLNPAPFQEFTTNNTWNLILNYLSYTTKYCMINLCSPTSFTIKSFVWLLFFLNWILYITCTFLYVTEQDDEIYASHKYNKDMRKLKIKIWIFFDLVNFK